MELSLQTRRRAGVTETDTGLPRLFGGALAAEGLSLSGVTSAEVPRPVQVLEIAIDALDVPAVRPSWKAVLGHDDGAGHDGPTDPLVDPAGQLPAAWFQQMDSARPGRHRVHLDVTVAHDEADLRLRAALAAGGVLVSDSRARSSWVLADAEGDEACTCTWSDRDGRSS